MSRTLTLAVLTLALVAVAGCGESAKVFIREDAEPIDMEVEKLLILPVEAWGFSGEGISDLDITLALVGGTAAAFGTNALMLQPFKEALASAGFPGMGRKLAWGTYHMLDFHQKYDLAADTCGQGIELVPVTVAKVVAKAAELLGLDFQPRYIFALGINGMGKGDPLGKTIEYRVIATIYDKEKKLVHSCTYYTATAPAGKAALAKIQGIPKEAFNLLMPKPEEEPVEDDADDGNGDAGEGDAGEGG